jgi:hypothetical protein
MVHTCPAPPTCVGANIRSSVAFDSKTNQYTYSYTVQNLKASLLSIKRFLVIVPAQPSNVHSPDKWHSDYGKTPSRANWSTYLADPSLPHSNQINPNSKGHRPAFYAIKPGAQLSGFSFQSPYPPGVTKYMIAGDTGIPSVTATATNDEPMPDCPGWDFNGPKYQTMVNGITQGPSDPNIISVGIRLREVDHDRPHGNFHPMKPYGKMSVLILSSKTFDASTVDPSSIQFGPGNAAPLSSKLVPAKEEQQDEREEWERFADLFKKGSDKEKEKKKDLLLVFDLKAVGIRCVLDHALFLSGKTKDGKAIAGAKAINTEGCDIKKPYVAPKASTREGQREEGEASFHDR